MDNDTIYDHNKTLELLENRIRNAQYAENDKDLIFKYEDYLFARGLSTARVIKHLTQLNIIASKWGISFQDATEDDMISLIGRIERQDYKLNTKNDYKRCISLFYKRICDDENPSIIKWIKIKRVNDSSVQKDDLLTQDEIMVIVNAAEHPRDKAFISVLADSGTRISELGNLTKNKIKFDSLGAILSVDGKTGPRTVRIVSSVPDLSRWLDMHPLEDEDAPVWVNVGTTNHNKKMKYPALRRILATTVKKAGIKKRVYPHLLRHTRGTEYANYLTEAQLDTHFGWVPGSTMHRTYVHLSSSDADQAVLAAHGLAEKSKNSLLTTKQCSRCSTQNSPASNMCSNCGCPLDLKASLDLEEIRKNLSIKIVEWSSADPQVSVMFQGNLSAA